MRNARLCRTLAQQGGDVVCATISLFHEVQRWNRANILRYHEIYLHVPMQELRRRDTKGIYAKADRGDLRDVVGLDLPAETPETPELVLENHGELDVATAVDRILAVCCNGNGHAGAQPEQAFTSKTKAESLERLAPLLRSARVLPQVRFSVSDWRVKPLAVAASINSTPWVQAA
jgi:hypothetical protein